MVRRYAYGPGQSAPLVMYQGSNWSTPRLLGTDHRGSVILVAKTSGETMARYSYGPWGEVQTTVVTPVNMPYRFTGQRADPELGLYFYNARFYNPRLGRFMSPDPLGYAHQLNLYAYVGNDPYNFVDPTGMTAEALGDVAHASWELVGSPSGNDIIDLIVPGAAGGRAMGEDLAAGRYWSAAVNLGAGMAEAGLVVRTGGLGETAALATSASKVSGGIARKAAAAADGALDTLVGLGKYAGESIPARSAAQRFTAAERAEINRIGAATGCHTCGSKAAGTKTGNFVPDHQPPSSLNTAGEVQKLYPHCFVLQ